MRRVLQPGAWIISAAVALAGAGALLKNEDYPSKDAWDGSSLLNVGYVVSAIVALVGGFLVAQGYAATLRRETRRDELADLCKTLWAMALRHTSVPFDKLGVHVWVVRGFKGARYLEKRATFVPEARRTTPITWRKQKGAIGWCWAENHALVADVEALEKIAPNEQAFLGLPAKTRFGLSWYELEESRHYRAVLAIPLRVRRVAKFRVRGVVSVDLRVDGKANELDTLSARDDFSAVLSVCEAVLRGRRFRG